MVCNKLNYLFCVPKITLQDNFVACCCIICFCIICVASSSTSSAASDTGMNKLIKTSHRKMKCKENNRLQGVGIQKLLRQYFLFCVLYDNIFEKEKLLPSFSNESSPSQPHHWKTHTHKLLSQANYIFLIKNFN